MTAAGKTRPLTKEELYDDFLPKDFVPTYRDDDANILSKVNEDNTVLKVFPEVFKKIGPEFTQYDEKTKKNIKYKVVVLTREERIDFAKGMARCEFIEKTVKSNPQEARLRGFLGPEEKEIARLKAIEEAKLATVIRKEQEKGKPCPSIPKQETTPPQAKNALKKPAPAPIRIVDKDAELEVLFRSLTSKQKEGITLTEQEKDMLSRLTEQESNRKQLIAMTVAKFLKSPGLFKTFVPPEDRSIDYAISKKQMIIKLKGMEKLVNMATTNRSYKPGDFSHCGDSRDNIEGISLFIANIPLMTVEKIVIGCPLLEDEIQSLAKEFKNANNKFIVELKHEATMKKFTEQTSKV